MLSNNLNKAYSRRKTTCTSEKKNGFADLKSLYNKSGTNNLKNL